MTIGVRYPKITKLVLCGLLGVVLPTFIFLLFASDAGLPTIIKGTLWLSGIVFGFGLCIWVLFEVALLLGDWLLEQKFMVRVNSYIWQKTQWWRFLLRKIVYPSRDLVSIIIDPLFYGYAIYSIINKFESIADFTKHYPRYDFWRVLDADVIRDAGFYVVFLFIFLIWLFSKSWKANQETRRDKSLEKILGILNNTGKK